MRDGVVKRLVVTVLLLVMVGGGALVFVSYEFVFKKEMVNFHFNRDFEVIYEKKEASDSFVLYKTSEKEVWYMFMKRNKLGWRVLLHNRVPLQSNEISWMVENKKNVILYVGQYNPKITQEVLINKQLPTSIEVSKENEIFYSLYESKKENYGLEVNWNVR